jgi:alpha-tubulin suppressor-like RCC1 family protein
MKGRPNTRLLRPLCSLMLLAFAIQAFVATGSGFVIGWGQNISGQATGTPSFPVPNGNGFATGLVTIASDVLSDAVAVSGGYAHSLALRRDGTVVAWGDNFMGKAIGSPTAPPYRVSGLVRPPEATLRPVSVVAGRDFSLAITESGSVFAWGETGVPADATNVIAIAAQEGHSWLLRRDGSVFGWPTRASDPRYSHLTQVSTLSNIVAISVGPGGNGTRGLALRSDGIVLQWGNETIHKDATPPSYLTNVVAVAAGYNHSVALRSDGSVVGWGFNNAGQATGSPTTEAPHISSGNVMLAGGPLTNVASIAASRGYSLALKKDGTVVSWGRMVNDQYPATVPAGLSNVIAISAGESFCLAITTNPVVAERFRAK